MVNQKKRIFFVDDEPQIRKIVQRTIERHGYDVICFEDGMSCLDELSVGDCDLLITDVNMPGLDGIELLEKVKKIRPLLDVLIVTGYGDIPMAVRAVKNGAYDFIEKPLDRGRLIPVIQNIFSNDGGSELRGKKLTRMEKKVLKFIVSGKSNKEIADVLHRSVRTIEDHRNHIMHKFDAKNAVELVKTAMNLEL
ncbi:MAG: response regulator transcription factor [Planctomycetes bacterium]|nr:response regulator transcription factor [Planctomycetota bacterium]